MSDNSEVANIHNHCKPYDNRKVRYECNYCGKLVSGITRMKFHLGGVGPDVKKCLAVSVDLKRLWRKVVHDCNYYRARRGGGAYLNRRKRKRAADDGGRSGQSRGRPRRRTFFYQTAVGSSRGPTMTDFAALPGSVRFNHVPSSGGGPVNMSKRYDVQEMTEYVKKIRESWDTTGCSILLDTWIDRQGRSLVNVLADCPQGPVYICTYNVSPFGNDLNSLTSLLDAVIKDVGEDNVVQIVAESTAGWVGALRKEFKNNRKGVFWAVSGSPCIRLILHRISLMPSTKRILEKAKMISKFLYSHGFIYKVWLRHTHGRGQLIKPSKVKGVMPFLLLDRLLKGKQALKYMFSSSVWNVTKWAEDPVLKRIAAIVKDHYFWAVAKMISKATMPLVQTMGLILEAHKPVIEHIFETMVQVKLKIKQDLGNKRYIYMPFLKIIDEVWDNVLDVPLFSAAYYLTPRLKYSSNFYCNDDVYLGLMSCISHMIRDPSLVDVIQSQLKLYVRAEGHFRVGSSAAARNTTPPVVWWSTYGNQCPELQKFAIRILSQNCEGASKYGLNRTLAEQLVTGRRNIIEQKWFIDQTFLEYNLQLRKFHSWNKPVEVEDTDRVNDWIVGFPRNVIS